ncbi:unnamed protein product [Miscanthus lutarioriparius]|uniref:Uncharacterized protein n=1 Tax=Miscanthus lutarioriparius TaxID=422564 RepID=A0A811NNM4_9POAL|nr:unnamed protein product [Miscanthus lutarioriparius]
MDVMLEQQQPPAGAGASSTGSTSPRLHVHIHETTLMPPSPSSPKTSLPLTFFDVFFLRSSPIERLFLYRLAPDVDIAAIISNLQDSLHQALHAFYPLTGRVRLIPGTFDRYELHYRPSDDAVTFTITECDDNDDMDTHFNGLTTDKLWGVAKIAMLVPPLPKGGHLLAV